MNPIIINNFEDYKKVAKEVIKNTLNSLGYNTPENTINETVKNDFKQKIEPILNLKNSFIGNENSLFNPVKKIKNICFYLGSWQVVFTYKNGKKQYFEELKYYNEYFLKR